MLEHLGEARAGVGLQCAVERVAADPRVHTPGLGGQAPTRQVTDAVCQALTFADN
jgi:tartrate dehydrogenase/decarboxylase/D-malate dehydrogenase